jgi:hypothetical protein
MLCVVAGACMIAVGRSLLRRKRHHPGSWEVARDLEARRHGQERFRVGPAGHVCPHGQEWDDCPDCRH